MLENPWIDNTWKHIGWRSAKDEPPEVGQSVVVYHGSYYNEIDIGEVRALLHNGYIMIKDTVNDSSRLIMVEIRKDTYWTPFHEDLRGWKRFDDGLPEYEAPIALLRLSNGEPETVALGKLRESLTGHGIDDMICFGEIEYYQYWRPLPTCKLFFMWDDFETGFSDEFISGPKLLCASST